MYTPFSNKCHYNIFVFYDGSKITLYNIKNLLLSAHSIASYLNHQPSIGTSFTELLHEAIFFARE